MLETIKPSIPVLIEDLGYLYPKENSSRKRHYGIYKCQCAKEFKAQIDNVKKGDTNSCGCYHKEIMRKIQTKHGLYGHKLYNTWAGMVKRVENKKCKDYINYGGRGIKVCVEWRNDFKLFYDWALENGYKGGLTIDRENNDGNYEPLNCRWTTKIIQSRNTRKIMSTNTSGYRGVCFDKIRNKWECNISVNSKKVRIGFFMTALEAAIAYDKYVTENNLEHTINGVL